MENKNKLLMLLIALIIIMTGAKLNFVVIMNNNGKMPLNIGRGNFEVGDYILYTNKSEVRNWYLGDIINIGNIIAFSIGDILILLGIGIFIYNWINIYKFHKTKHLNTFKY